MNNGLILVTGASGKLGSVLVDKLGSEHIVSPTRAELDITNLKSVSTYFEKNKGISKVIHCAALTNMPECEKSPGNAMNVNMVGTLNLINESSKIKNLRFIYISTDYIYPCESGNYKEDDVVAPFNNYAWSKFAGECTVRNITNHCIIRTSFFDPNKIPFDTAPIDVFCSKLPIDELAINIISLLDNNFTGVINVGQEKISLYELYLKYKPSIQPTTLSEILKIAPIKRAKDSSLDITLWKEIRSQINGN